MADRPMSHARPMPEQRAGPERAGVEPHAVRARLAADFEVDGISPLIAVPRTSAPPAGGDAEDPLPERADRALLLPPRRGADGVTRREVVVRGWRFEVELEPAARAALRERATRGRDAAGHSGPTEVRAIIPGVVVSVAVRQGDQVEAGQQLLAVEAMKMQNELRAPRSGTIERIAAVAGRTIEVGELLLVIA